MPWEKAAKMDRASEQEMLINASACAAILCVDGQYVLVALDGSPLPDPGAPKWRGAVFYGCVAIVDGRLSVSLDMEINPSDLHVLAMAFKALVSTKAKADPLERLYRLPDPRSAEC